MKILPAIFILTFCLCDQGLGQTSAPCSDLTAKWASVNPTAELCLEVNLTTGSLIGLVRNASDPFFVEIVGRVDLTSYSVFGYNGIWALELAVSGFVGECHKCDGEDVLLINALSHLANNTPVCGDSGQLKVGEQYTFYRSGPPCRGLDLDVWKPSQISNRLGVNIRTPYHETRKLLEK